MYLNSLLFRAAGVTFNNDDGSSRQKYIERLNCDRLWLVPFEYEGNPAFHLVDLDNHCIGSVPAIYVDDILEHQKQGHSVIVTVMDILGKDENGRRIPGYNLGVEVGIDFFDDQPEPPENNAEQNHPVVEATASPVHKSNKKTGRVMIGFGVFFALGFFVAFNPVFLVVSVLLLFFGIRRNKNYKKGKSD